MADEIILIVEDNDLLREGLREMLTYDGFTVLTARNGREALEMMYTVTPELIVSDVTMPLLDGFSLFTTIRKQPEWVTIPFIFLTARAEPSDVLVGRDLGAEDYLTKPISREELVTAIRARLVRSRQVQLVQLQTAYQASLTALANAIDSRDLYSHGHVERVTSYVFTIAKHLGWSDQTIEQLRYGAILHDIGKIHISESILLKPTSLSEAEWKEIHKHPVTGAEMVKGVPFLAKAEAIVRHHHERWDGTGYPDGLAEESIPEGARLVSVADSFDVMTHLRPYGRRLSLEEAFDEILSLAGKKYDPQVIAAFRRAWEGGQIHVIAGET